jgi:hypothetical protein
MQGQIRAGSCGTSRILAAARRELSGTASSDVFSNQPFFNVVTARKTGVPTIPERANQSGIAEFPKTYNEPVILASARLLNANASPAPPNLKEA